MAARIPPDTRLATRLAQLDAQRTALKARLSKQARARDTRRKILLGAFVLHQLDHHPETLLPPHLDDWLRQALPGFLRREADRALLADLLSTLTQTEAEALSDALPADAAALPPATVSTGADPTSMPLPTPV